MKIICDKCKKEVDLIKHDYNPRTQTEMYKVFCHGEEETAELTVEIIESAIKIEGGIAFKKSKFITNQSS